LVVIVPEAGTNSGSQLSNESLEMSRAAATTALPGAEFNEFLFAAIGEDRNGVLVSVLSGLARLDVDPWQEAAKLAQLPGDIATRKLASLIGALRDRDSSYPDPPTIAAHLIALLPRRNDARKRPRDTPHGIAAAINSRPWWIYVVFISFVLSTQLVIASKQLPTKGGGVRAESSSTVSPPIPPIKSEQ
jgi:hypothetical protein